MTLTQLRYIVSIADSGLNITLAAERIHATQPGVSKQLKQLEGELGFQLFARKGKSLKSVTPAGQQVIARARAILDEARSIRALAANLRGDAHGDLTVLTTHTQARFVLPSAIAAFGRKHPRVGLHLRPHGDAQIHGLFAGGQADLAIISSSGPAPLGGLAVPLYRWRRSVVVPRGHALARLSRPLRLGDLAGQPLVSYDSSLRPESSLQQAFQSAGMRPLFACTSSDADLIKTYVRAGLGVGVLAEMAIRPEDNRELQMLDAAHLLPDCTTWLVLRRDRVLRSYTLDLVEQFAPHLDRRDLQAALSGEFEPNWPAPPHWSELQRDAMRTHVAA
ncbi:MULTISPECIES: LysR substrate-binding domain-containing protein [Oleiagrimonas]|uniref:LysR family transcriptional regulator n=1 Tax=Oleiagrimonas citrea TaxID=1665687 RepID=A0A846ZI51_9GAMM|nr:MULTISPECIES: LysR substrate-binding domain-containing protein [Oleiagrimonas]NKZ38065.1 LysR family transcriptional regulator [Oleiagrimonas citrea]RAP56261.1 CysB family transcriptional regulator [Oleiagrimonas sp. MCCC 1A03011]